MTPPCAELSHRVNDCDAPYEHEKPFRQSNRRAGSLAEIEERYAARQIRRSGGNVPRCKFQADAHSRPFENGMRVPYWQEATQAKRAGSAVLKFVQLPSRSGIREFNSRHGSVRGDPSLDSFDSPINSRAFQAWAEFSSNAIRASNTRSKASPRRKRERKASDRHVDDLKQDATFSFQSHARPLFHIPGTCCC